MPKIYTLKNVQVGTVFKKKIILNSMALLAMMTGFETKAFNSSNFKDHLNHSSKNEFVSNKETNEKVDLQDRLIQGVILDDLGDPLPGVSILVKGTTRGTTTDLDGNFSLQVPPNAVLVVSYLGFKTREITVGSQSRLDIRLEQQLSDLTEFVVTGYGVQEKRAITGAMSSIKGDVIQNFPVVSMDRALQGQISGVNVMANNGVPGGPVTFQIRGVGSITAGSQPLIIVDGVQLNMTSSAGNTASNPLAFLNTNDIESIEVLKDGAAASIYGAQAANGVILVTTKSGKAGKTQFNLNVFTGITEPMPVVEMMNSQEFFDVRLTAFNNQFPNRTPAQNRALLLPQLGFPADFSDAEIAALPTYDWQREAFRTGTTKNIELSASGGNDKTTFLVSGSHNYTEGNVVGIDFQRSTAKFRLNHQENKRLSFGFDVNLASILQNGSTGSAGSTGAFAAPQYSSPMMLPWIPIFLEDGSYNAPVAGFPGNMDRNAISETLLNDLESKTKSIVGNFNVTYKILDNLSFRSFYGFDYRVIDQNNYTDPRTRSGFATQGSLSIANIQNFNFLTNQTLNYNTKFEGGHNLSALLGAEYRSDSRELSSSNAQGFPTFQFRTMQAAAVITSASANWTGFRRLGAFSQVNYDYKKKYLLSGVLRYDGSSRFGADNLFGWFPAISAGWNVHEEAWLTDKSWIDQIKLRAGYGETGNDAIGNFDSRGLYQGLSAANYNQEPGIRPSAIANTFLAWERNVTTNIGLDYAFFGGRVSGAFEVYRRLSKDLLLDTPLPWTSGFSNVTQNVGKLKNEGIEIEIQTKNIVKKDFTWTTNFNITFINNEVLDLGGNDVLPGNQSVRVGYSLGTNWTAKYAGVNSATGRPMWFDANGDITYNPVSPGDFYTFGNSLSSYFGGLTNTLTFKGFTVSALFIYDFGRELSNSGQMQFWSRNGQDNRNSLRSVYAARWTEPGQVTNVPRPIGGGAETGARNQNSGSSRFLEDASFIRLRQLAFSYDVPKQFLSRMKLRSAQIYAQGANLLTWTEWRGYDPELVIDEGNFTSTQGALPQTRAYTLGVQIGF
ncbi:SusC/RagA family TonB-linked outer membrane protein [Cecembia rubra]|uniref:SusC/RagA family TonB-linked outer membrane protein n=1 Tax=Cecembia rubra TaxID=1485585 RepID=UPI00271530D0|nr:TonB-dependent receptor [Cecembia rubra]